MSPTTVSAARAPRAPKPFYRSFGFQVLAAMVVGLILGYIARQMGPDAAGNANWLTQTLSTIGSLFVSLLRALVPVLVFTAIVASIANLRELNNAAKLVWQTLLWFAITALIAVAIGIALGLIIQPGLNTAVAGRRGQGAVIDRLVARFPQGPDPLQIFGLAGFDPRHRRRGHDQPQLQRAADPGDLDRRRRRRPARSARPPIPFLAFNRSFLTVVRKILWWVIRLTPDRHHRPARQRRGRLWLGALAQLGWYSAAIYIGLALVLFVVYPVLLHAHGLNPVRYFAERLAGDPACLRLALVDRHPAGDRSA